MRINLREIKKVSRLPRSSHHKKLQLEQPLRGRCHVLQPAAWTSQFLSSTSPTVPEPSWGNLRDEELLKFSFLLSQCSMLSPEVGKIAAKEQAEMNVYTLSLPVFLGKKKTVIKTGKPFGEGVEKQLEQLNIAETLSGIFCLLSTVYQSLHLHLGPGLTGESTGALNEMDKWKLGEQKAVTAAQNFPFNSFGSTLLLTYFCTCSGVSVWTWNPREDSGAERESVKKNKCSFK